MKRSREPRQDRSNSLKARRGTDDGREGLFDERVRLVRPGRLIAGGVMIAIAIVWLAIENLMSLNGKQAATPGLATAVPTLPALSTPQAFSGGRVNAALLGREKAIPGHPVRKGYQFWVVAIQVSNDRSTLMHLGPASFTLRSRLQTFGPGRLVTGHTAAFASGGIGAGRQAEGDLFWQVADSVSPTVLRFIAPDGKHPIVWSLP